MAIVEMKKLKLIGLSSEKDKILNRLLSTGGIQLKPTKEVELTVKRADENRREKTLSTFARLSFAIEFLHEQTLIRKSYAKKDATDTFKEPKKPFFAVRKEVSGSEFEGISLEEIEILEIVETLEKMSARLTSLKSEKNSCLAEIDSLKNYECFNEKFSIAKNTKSVTFLLGVIKNSAINQLNALKEKYTADISIFSPEKSLTPMFCAVINEEADAFFSELTALGFNRCPYSEDITAKEKINKIKKRLTQISTESKKITFDAVEYNKNLDNIKLLYDNEKFILEKIEADSEFAKTSSTFILEGFVPVTAQVLVEKAINKATKNVVVMFEDVEKEDNPPTLCHNNAVVSAYESITNMYSPPSYYEKDPNIFVCIFFFIFFGFMLGDAGYGLILAIGGALLLKFVKMETPMRRMIVLFTLGGVSTIIWGAVFGGWFAIDNIGFLQYLCWFNPMDEPILMLAVALGLGCVQIVFAMGIRAKDLIKEGNIVDAVFEIFSWYALFIGIGLFAVSIFVPQILYLNYVAYSIIGIGLIMIIYGGSRHHKGFSKIIKGLGALYGIVNYVSDILSYSRLFGLGLATGAIGMVMNQLAGMVMNSIPVVGVIFGVVILVVGHLFNMGINLLGVYVHDSRLQFVEFFGKFYKGNGQLFVPLGSKLKYTSVQIQED